MLRQALLLSLAVAFTFAAPYSIEDVPEQYRDMIPPEAKEFLTGLTAEDKAVLKEVAKNYASYKNEEEALAALKAKSPALGEKAEKLHEMVKAKVNGLGEEARAFAKEMIAGLRKIQTAIVAGTKPNLAELKEKAQIAIGKYKALSDGAKDELKKTFPILTSIATNEKFQQLAEKFLAKAN